MKAFTNVDEDNEKGDGNEKLENAAEPMDTSTVEDDTLPPNSPFLERPEGQLLVSRLLQNEKKSGSRKCSPGYVLVERFFILTFAHYPLLQTNLLVSCVNWCRKRRCRLGLRATGRASLWFSKFSSPIFIKNMMLIAPYTISSIICPFLLGTMTSFLSVSNSLYELNNEEICDRLKKVLCSRKDLIMASPLPGAKILAKHLFS